MTSYCIQDVLLSRWPNAKKGSHSIKEYHIYQKGVGVSVLDSANLLSQTTIWRINRVDPYMRPRFNHLIQWHSKCQGETGHFSCLHHQMYLQSLWNIRNFYHLSITLRSERKGAYRDRCCYKLNWDTSSSCMWLSFVSLFCSPPQSTHTWTRTNREHVKSVRWSAHTHINNSLENCTPVLLARPPSP